MEFKNVIIDNRFKYLGKHSSFNFYEDTLCGGFAEQINFSKKTVSVCKKCGDFVYDQYHGLVLLIINTFRIHEESNVNYISPEPSSTKWRRHTHSSFPSHQMIISDYINIRSDNCRTSRTTSTLGPH